MYLLSSYLLEEAVVVVVVVGVGGGGKGREELYVIDQKEN